METTNFLNGGNQDRTDAVYVRSLLIIRIQGYPCFRISFEVDKLEPERQSYHRKGRLQGKGKCKDVNKINLAEYANITPKILALIPSLRVLDGQRFDAKFLERKRKHEANANLVEKKQRLKRLKEMKKKESELTDDNSNEQTQPKDAKSGKKRKQGDTKLEETKKKAKRKGPEASNEDAVDGKVKEQHKRQRKAQVNTHDTTKLDSKSREKKAKADKEKSTKMKKRSAENKQEKALTKPQTAEKAKKQLKRKEATQEHEAKPPKKRKDNFFETAQDANASAEPISTVNPVTASSAPVMSDAMKQKSGVVAIVDKTKKKGGKDKKDGADEALAMYLENAKKAEEAAGTGLSVLGAVPWDD